MEYMTTGVPMVTTKLAGIPKEYYEYVFTFEESTEECYYKTLLKILALPSEEIRRKGKMAQEFVLSKKNKKTQTARIVELIK